MQFNMYIVISECVCFTGYIFLVLLNTANVISAFTKCYPLNGQEYCFYTDGSVLSWDEAREFCTNRNSTLPIVTDEDIDNVWRSFIFDNQLTDVSDSETERISSYVWLDAHALRVDNSVNWHWINGQPSGITIAHCRCKNVNFNYFLFPLLYHSLYKLRPNNFIIKRI